jgi:hypothetical protein
MSRKLGNSFERNLKVRAKGSLTSLSMKLQEHVVAKPTKKVKITAALSNPRGKRLP